MQIRFKKAIPETLKLSAICEQCDESGVVYDGFVDEHDRLYLIGSDFVFDPLSAVAYYEDTEFKVKCFCNVEITVL